MYVETSMGLQFIHSGNKSKILFGMEGENKMIKEARFISIWDGEHIETACKVDTDTKEVFDIEQSDYTPEGICEGEYIVIDGREYEVFTEDNAGDNEYWY